MAIAIIVVAVFVVLYVLLFIRALTSTAGGQGEHAVARRLRRLPKDRYFIINDLMIEKYNGHTTQIDHVVISPYGVFVIETKNISGYVYGYELSPQWKRHWKGYKRNGLYGSDTMIFDNPILQNGAHIKALRERLRNYNTRFISIIAFSPKATLKVDVHDVDVIYWNQIVDVIKMYHEEVMSIDQAREIYEFLSNINISDKEQRKAHAERAQRYKNEYLNKQNTIYI